MNFELDVRVLKYWRLTAAVIFAVVFLILFIIFSNTLGLILLVVFLVTYFIVAYIYLPLRFKTTCLRVTTDYLIIKRGVIVSKEYIFPNKRTVYIQSINLPIASIFKLNVILTRGIGCSIILPPLTNQQTEKVLKAVKE